jgi:hypothetical protein
MEGSSARPVGRALIACALYICRVSDPTAAGDTSDRLARALGPKYEVRRLVGRGGFAEVYEVFDKELERRLAVKVLRPDIAWTSGMLQRFKQETKAIARLQHPNILPIHFVGEGEGIVYYAMPYVEGQSLGDLLRRTGRLAPDRAVDIAAPVLDALRHAHEQGLVHRDIKPDNIMIENASGRPLLVDFGIAKQIDSGSGLTQTGFVVGTPHYMSPEQALGQGNLDARSDLYAFGAVLFQMVTGTPPFDGETSQEIVGKHLAEPPPVPKNVDARIPLWLSNVITRCLQKLPNERFQSAAMVLDALSQGRASGSREQVSVQRAVTVAADAKTELVPSGERAVTTTPRPAAGRTAGRQTGGRVGWWMGIGAAIVVVAAVAGFWFTRPVLVFENHLAAPVRVTAAARERVVQPGGRVRAPLRRGRPFVAAWTLVRPVGPTGVPEGVEVSGSVNLPRPRGRHVVEAHAGVGDTDFFAPLITNNTGRPLTVIVNAGLQSAMPCNCTVPAGAVRQMIGYYPLYRNSTVRVAAPGGRSATFSEELVAEVDRRSGIVSLRFEAANLR